MLLNRLLFENSVSESKIKQSEFSHIARTSSVARVLRVRMDVTYVFSGKFIPNGIKYLAW